MHHILATTLLALAALAEAQLSAVPACASQVCVSLAIEATSCQTSDTACWCGAQRSVFDAAFEPCVTDSCAQADRQRMYLCFFCFPSFCCLFAVFSQTVSGSNSTNVMPSCRFFRRHYQSLCWEQRCGKHIGGSGCSVGHIVAHCCFKCSEDDSVDGDAFYDCWSG